MIFTGLVAIFKVQLLLFLSSSPLPPLSLPAFAIPADFIENLIKSTIALFVVIDPMGNVPLFIALTEKMGKNERKAVSKIAIITAADPFTAFAVAGLKVVTLC